MTEHQCTCGRPAPDATICGRCTDRLAKDLGDVPAYARELETTLTRQRAVTYDGSRAANTALPFDLGASEASWVLRSTLVGWIRVLDEDGVDWPHGDVTSMSRWLLARIHDLATHEAGDQAVEELGSAITLVRRAVDRPADRIYAGTCGAPKDSTESTLCEAELYALPGHDLLTCQSCGASWDVSDRRRYLLDQIEDVLATATEIARGVSNLGAPVNAERIRQWKARNRLEVRGINLRGDPLYRCGDVLDLLAADATRAAAS